MELDIRSFPELSRTSLHVVASKESDGSFSKVLKHELISKMVHVQCKDAPVDITFHETDKSIHITVTLLGKKRDWADLFHHEPALLKRLQREFRDKKVILRLAADETV